MRAICMGVDRVAGKCLVQFPVPDGSDDQPEVIAVRYHGDPPAPLTYVNMREVSSGSWICNGSLANVESRLVEDWESVSQDANDFVYGSTPWFGETSELTLTGITAFDGEFGQVALTTTTGTNDYLSMVKSGVNQDADEARDIAWWLEAKCTVSQSTLRMFGVGFKTLGDAPFNAAGAPYLMMISDTATSSDQLRLVANDTGVSTEVNTGFTPTAGTPFIVHIMAMGTQWAAGWVVESSTAAQDLETTVHGPFVVTSNLVVAAPAVAVKTLTTAAKAVRCDYVRLSTVHPVVHPNEVLSG